MKIEDPSCHSLPDYLDALHWSAAKFRTQFDAAFEEKQAEVELIASESAPPTFVNTIAALETSGRRLQQLTHIFLYLCDIGVHHSYAHLQEHVSAELVRSQIGILHDKRLSDRVAQICRPASLSQLGQEEEALAQRYQKFFVEAGAYLNQADKQQYRATLAELAKLQSLYSRNLIESESSLTVARLGDGNERYPSKTNDLALTLNSLYEILTSNPDRQFRADAFRSWNQRCEQGNRYDNTAIVSKIIELRNTQAQLLGYSNYASFRLKTQMVGSPKNAYAFIDTRWAAAKSRAHVESENLRILARQEGLGEHISPSDWRYLKELDSSSDTRASTVWTTDFDAILRAAFTVSNKLFGLSFIPDRGVSAFAEGILFYRVADLAGEIIGHLVVDPRSRAGKRAVAWTASI